MKTIEDLNGDILTVDYIISLIKREYYLYVHMLNFEEEFPFFYDSDSARLEYIKIRIRNHINMITTNQFHKSKDNNYSIRDNLVEYEVRKFMEKYYRPGVRIEYVDDSDSTYGITIPRFYTEKDDVGYKTLNDRSRGSFKEQLINFFEKYLFITTNEIKIITSPKQTLTIKGFKNADDWTIL